MKPIVRFAPSPTGKLHVGNVRTALVNWLYAAKEGGEFILRIDDTDTGRSTKAYEDGIKEDLSWLGMVWGQTFNQSDRFDIYDDAANNLREIGLLYACYETSEELDRQRKILRAQGKPPVYDRAGLALTPEDKAKLEAEGRTPHWRFKLSGKTVSWDDMVRGTQNIDTSSLSDPVLIRGDGSYLYTLPSVVDDIDANITHIIRGEDHVTNSGAQIEIFEALGGPIPNFAHTPLLVGRDGKGLSKRLGSLSMDQLREQGIEPMAICSLLGKIGTSDPVEARQNMAQLVEEFAFSKIGRAPARFDEAELDLVNARLLHETPYVDVKDRLDAMGVAGGEEFWLMVRTNLNKLGDAAGWSTVFYAPMPGQIADEDMEFCKQAADMLASNILLAGNIDENTWSEWTNALKESTGRKGKTLFLPLRMALTGRARGPGMDQILPLLGVERAKGRLQGKAT
ncbi:MAG: glutamate--tRNA ligase [Robiginitomaculum sp.]|nr:MAG: glutamate--tRNA ligase [Robiginitomaculum sp.]PHQ68081.1 MAG: glutamate--tRNA ligase [Robiginitomaculum sp.]